MALSDHARGYLITLSGVLLLTPDTLLIRLAAVDSFTLAVTRGGLGGAVILLAMWIWHRGGLMAEFRRIRFWALVVAGLQAVGMILFVVALDYTTAANVLIFFATTPLLAALLSWAFIGERVAPVTWAAILICFAGLVIVASGSFGTLHLLGDALAFLDAASLAAFYVVIRRHREVSNGLVDGGQGWVVDGREGDVIETSHRNIGGNLQARVLNGTNCAHRHHITGGKNRIYLRF